ncbi:P-loop containing nucleoside triphosphate hydrolase protein [Chaetomidium leptoderma]|uniref:P-loop containing nucleoside triphosphate hydrolase protein n=1 Tax=Chaetomidium leptoderma TaxID=669021 RepID=A0AAN6ZSY2_9PEZI|nr:P-loop containing nucleoside triphosphate hydrolase protein [Chaetomidium leptoderma]
MTGQCILLPDELNLPFFGRDDELRALTEALHPEPKAPSRLRAIGIYGRGGVGKSQLALQYADTSLDVYQVVAWIPADTETKLVHALSSLARKLGLVDGGLDNDRDDWGNLNRVRDWLNTTNKPFLLVFDNVERDDLLNDIWPATGQGSIIVTSRNPSTASKRATTVLALSSFPTNTRREILQSLSGLDFADTQEMAAADAICELTGGFPLAIVQISNFMRDGGLSYGSALEALNGSAQKVYTKSRLPAEYGQTGFIACENSLRGLSPEATALLSLLVFFAPESIPERFITNEHVEIRDARLQFVWDSFTFRETVAELVQTSLITRLPASRALSMRGLVQFVTFSRLSESDTIANFDLAVQVVSSSFPSSWKEGGAHQGHGWASWEACSVALPHIAWLVGMMEKHRFKPANLDLWTDLLLGAGTYLWEKEEPSRAKLYVERGLAANQSLPIAVAAQARRLLGNIFLDLARPRAALAEYEQALALRESLDGPDSPAVADMCDYIAYAYTELDDVDQAFAYIERATGIHKDHDPSKMSRTLTVRAMTCLRAGFAGGALAALFECWRLQGMTYKDMRASNNPQHSGDIMLLGRIFLLQGNAKDAANAIERALAMRRIVYGEDKGPRLADSYFYLTQARGGKGIEGLVDTLVKQCGQTPEMRAHEARSFWFWANRMVKQGARRDSPDVIGVRERAWRVRSAIGEREWPDEETDEGYMRLVPWMLW